MNTNVLFPHSSFFFSFQWKLFLLYTELLYEDLNYFCLTLCITINFSIACKLLYANLCDDRWAQTICTTRKFTLTTNSRSLAMSRANLNSCSALLKVKIEILLLCIGNVKRKLNLLKYLTIEKVKYFWIQKFI